MKFSSQYSASQFEEWRSKYFRYAAIKSHIQQLFPHKKKKAQQNLIHTSKLASFFTSSNNNQELNTSNNTINPSKSYGSFDLEDEEDEESVENPRYNSDYLLSEGERADQIMTKLLHELLKINDFYKAVEEELVVSFQSLKAQISTATGELTSNAGAHLTHSASSGNINRELHSAPLSQYHYSNNNNTNINLNHHNNHNNHHHQNNGHVSDALNVLKANFISLLRRETMLIHYVDINIYAFQRVLKIFESRSGIIGIESKFNRSLSNHYIGSSRVLEDELIPATYKLFADYYENGDIERAKIFLLGKLAETDYSRVDTFVLGLKIGIIFMLIIWNFMLLIEPVPGQTATLNNLAMYAPIYRSCGLLILWLWLWGVLIYVWDLYRIAYVFVFQLNPRNRLTHFQVFNEASNLSIVYLINCLLLISHYDHALDQYISSAVYPLSLFLYFITKLLIPTDLFSNWPSRRTLLASLLQIFIAPFGKVRFRENYIADVLTSMVKLLVDLLYCFAFVFSGYWWKHGQHHYSQTSSSNTVGTTNNDNQNNSNAIFDISSFHYTQFLVPFICCIPLWLRFQQCLRRYYDTKKRFPHLANALKYAVAHSVVIISAFHPSFTDQKTKNWATYRLIWLFSTGLSTLYTFSWDISQDWGLIQYNKPANNSNTAWYQNFTFRSNLLYHNKYFYIWVIVSNFFLRFCWVITLVPFPFAENESNNNPNTAGSTQQLKSWMDSLFSWQYILLPLLTTAELFRRFQWSLIRVEYEHLTNGSGFRMSYYIPMMFINKKDSNSKASGNNNNLNNKLDGANGLSGSSSAGVIAEVVCMVVIVIIVAVIGAIM